MSLCYDGDHSFAGDPSSLYKEKIEDSSFGGKKGPSIEAAFRGFEKLPVVLAERIDITPYLSKTSVGAEPGNKTTGINLSSFFNKCSVSVARVDLERLRDSLSIKSWDSDDSAMGSVNNMSNVQCNICGKVYSSEKKLHNHQENKHMIVYKPQKPKPLKRVSFSDKVIVHEVMVYHKCRKCTKIFEDYKSLKAHKKQKHKKRKCYICNYCAKKFVDRMFFKVHIKLHCEVCSLLLPNKAQYLDHKRNVCRVIKLHKCKTCDKSFFKFMDLKDHSHEHVNEYYVCDICKDQCPTQCALGHHIAFLHSEQRPNTLYEMRALGNERLYLCNFCEESSVDRKLIENHVQLLPDLTNRAMTGYEDYYFCDQCLKKFSMESEMLQHKWTHFLKTSDNSQERPKGILVNKNNATKITYRVNEEIPQCFQPKVVLEKLKVGGKLLTETVAFVDVNSFDVHNGDIKKPVVHPKSKKTIISKHQCQVGIYLYLVHTYGNSTLCNYSLFHIA